MILVCKSNLQFISKKTSVTIFKISIYTRMCSLFLWLLKIQDTFKNVVNYAKIKFINLGEIFPSTPIS